MRQYLLEGKPSSSWLKIANNHLKNNFFSWSAKGLVNAMFGTVRQGQLEAASTSAGGLRRSPVPRRRDEKRRLQAPPERWGGGKVAGAAEVEQLAIHSTAGEGGAEEQGGGGPERQRGTAGGNLTFPSLSFVLIRVVN